MARKGFSVDELVEVLHQWHKGRSITQIKHSVGMDRKTIRKYICLADGHGFKRDMGIQTYQYYLELAGKIQRGFKTPLDSSPAYRKTLLYQTTIDKLLIKPYMTPKQVYILLLKDYNIEAVLNKLRSAGIKIDVYTDSIRAVADNGITAVDIRTMPYPGFPTDMQAQIMALMTVSKGLSVITETIFENRYIHVPELQRMGANIKVEGKNAIVEGVKSLSGAQVMATDLRASASLVLAGLVAEGQTEVQRIYHLDRGYESMELKLAGIGADIVRVK